MPQNKRIVVLISGSGSNLQALIDACNSRQIAGDIVGVLSNKADVFGLERAQQAGIENCVLKHTQFESREQYDAALVEQIDAWQPDLVVLAGFMRILTADFVQHYKGRLLNIHPSLLPKYQGLNTHQRALDAGDKEHGVSVHFVTEELDGGPVILQAKVPIFAGDQAADLQARVHEQEHRIYPLVVNWFCTDRLTMGENCATLDGAILPASGYASDE
ncbi:phosphoribosylglycinamide formyltransferase [Thalassotalea maritima]|uniref:phosphoribosylglycinamide formyltransferase n=1 Tax=Thalassotalea maritima TaxID=3242416 RepID=UPI003527BF7E